jgi:DeoR/GlpR family transcriptional regulator of sugar metabolism
MQSASPLLRQWSLLRAIAADGEATIKSLVAETGMSDKTIRRDIAVLRNCSCHCRANSTATSQAHR